MPRKGKIIPYQMPLDWSPRFWKSYYKTMRERLIRGDEIVPPHEYAVRVRMNGNFRHGSVSLRPEWCPPIIYRRWLARNAYNRAHGKPEIHLHTMDGIDKSFLRRKNARILERNGIDPHLAPEPICQDRFKHQAK